MINGSPGIIVAKTTFRDKAMDMGIPFEVTSKSMQNADKSGCELQRLIELIEQTKNDTANSRKKTVQQ